MQKRRITTSVVKRYLALGDKLAFLCHAGERDAKGTDSITYSMTFPVHPQLLRVFAVAGVSSGLLDPVTRNDMHRLALAFRTPSTYKRTSTQVDCEKTFFA
jgi:hypothetical protein